ncbi:MAG: ABC transporter ATP-binding protein [Planctomycetes bacterium]|nr:ABC transporter ATP-binding protein [Planctomycetota bacterium]
MSSHPDVALRAFDLTKRYGDLTAVDHLSFEVARGEIFGFLGPNGAGKTTSLKMLCGLLRPDAGHVEIDGRTRGPGTVVDPGSIGVAPQATAIWDTLTCFEQLDFMGRMYGLPGTVARRRANELLAVLGLTEKTHKLGRTLSGGMQRRLNIALALVHQPAILFLDEPQAGLDPQSRVLVREYIRAIAGTTTIVLTTHDMEEAEKLSHRVCIIDRGRLLALETVERIKTRIGEGDLFEVEIAGGDGPVLEAIIRRLANEVPALAASGKTLRFTATDAGAVLPVVLAVVRSHGLGVGHVRIRERTLEDVFIHLTGRGLRE